jgi:hypothetical protein
MWHSAKINHGKLHYAAALSMTFVLFAASSMLAQEADFGQLLGGAADKWVTVEIKCPNGSSGVLEHTSAKIGVSLIRNSVFYEMGAVARVTITSAVFPEAPSIVADVRIGRGGEYQVQVGDDKEKSRRFAGIVIRQSEKINSHYCSTGSEERKRVRAIIDLNRKRFGDAIR